MEQFLLSLEPERKVLTVSELNGRIRQFLDSEFNGVWVSGEISGVKIAASGHYYFTLKDRESQIRCVCFRMTARFLKFKPQDGVAVMARGRIDVYEARGEYQLLVEALEPQGYGALQFAFEQLKKKLGAEGLFEAARKRPLPKLPNRIGLVTSPSGAVIQDMLQILARRFPGLHIKLYPAQVQGDGAIEAVCRGIRYFSESGWAEVVIIARGGGSLEDLWTFNEEDVARAIVACVVPVISAIGHETDFTIADFVADLRAPTPSAAAELVICTREQLLEQIVNCRRHLERAIRFRLSSAARELGEQGVDRAVTILHRSIGRQIQRIDELDYCARDMMRNKLRARREQWTQLDARLRQKDLRLRFAAARNRLETARTALSQSILLRLSRKRASLDPLAVQLIALSPTKILERGYAIVRDTDGHVVKDAATVPVGAELQILLAKGTLKTEVTQ
jgi:exodeoxyribonuclease VII large subunit